MLTAGPDFRPFEPHLPLRGMLTYDADEARFTECLTGRDYPLVQDGDYEALEHAYLAAGAEAGGPIMASFDGAIVQPTTEGEAESAGGPGRAVRRGLAGRDLRAGRGQGEPDQHLLEDPPDRSTAGARHGAGRREPNLILREDESRFTATVGCNQLTGGYTLTGDRAGLRAGGLDQDGVPEPPLDAWEAQLGTCSRMRRATGSTGRRSSCSTPVAIRWGSLQAVYLY